MASVWTDFSGGVFAAAELAAAAASPPSPRAYGRSVVFFSSTDQLGLIRLDEPCMPGVCAKAFPGLAGEAEYGP